MTWSSSRSKLKCDALQAAGIKLNADKEILKTGEYFYWADCPIKRKASLAN